MGHTTNRAQRGRTLLAATKEILPLVREQAEATEELGRLPDPLLDALIARRLFRLWIPRSLGGEELDLVPSLRIVEMLSGADGSTGWTVMIGAGTGLFAGFLEHDTAREIFGPEDAVIAGSGSPSGVAREADGGYRVSGRWAYGSGAHHAGWFTANCIVQDADGRARRTPDDGPLIRAVAVPAAQVKVHDTWSVSALCGTGSEDFEVSDCFVPADKSFSVFTDAPREPGPLYRFPFFSAAELSFAAVSLGIARHALEAFHALSQVKKPTGSESLLKDDPDVQSRYARAEALVRSARASIFEVAAKAWGTVVDGDTLSRRARTGIRLAAVDAAACCARAVDLLYQRAGMTPLFTHSAFGRAWRDVHAVTQNMAVSANLYTDAGRVLLGADPPERGQTGT